MEYQYGDEENAFNERAIGGRALAWRSPSLTPHLLTRALAQGMTASSARCYDDLATRSRSALKFFYPLAVADDPCEVSLPLLPTSPYSTHAGTQASTLHQSLLVCNFMLKIMAGRLSEPAADGLPMGHSARRIPCTSWEWHLGREAPAWAREDARSGRALPIARRGE